MSRSLWKTLYVDKKNLNVEKKITIYTRSNTITKDFKQFSNTKLLFDNDFNVIDATIQKNGDQYYMFLKDETKNPAQKNIRIATSKKLIGEYGNVSAPITGKYWAEGPTVLKKGEKWLLYFDKYTHHSYGVIESIDLKNWVDLSTQLEMPNGIRHGTVFTVSRSEFETLIIAEQLKPVQ